MVLLIRSIILMGYTKPIHFDEITTHESDTHAPHNFLSSGGRSTKLVYWTDWVCYCWVSQHHRVGSPVNGTTVFPARNPSVFCDTLSTSKSDPSLSTIKSISLLSLARIHCHIPKADHCLLLLKVWTRSPFPPCILPPSLMSLEQYMSYIC